MILLTDEEIKEAGKWHSTTIKDAKIIYADGILCGDDRDKAVAKAQLRKMVEYLNEQEFYEDAMGDCAKLFRDNIVGALLKEIE